MSENWGPHFIVPVDELTTYSGVILLREELDRELLNKDLLGLNLLAPVARIINPWYYRKKGSSTWIKIGESDDEENRFPVRWDTTGLDNGEYEVMGFMHVFVKHGGRETAIARQNIVQVMVKN
jgi:hypothetical protein